MARQPRSSLLPERGVFHVTLRGVARQPIVRDAHDADAFVAQLEETPRRFGWQLLEWCLMPNHAHLVVSVGRDILSRAIGCRATPLTVMWNTPRSGRSEERGWRAMCRG